MLKTIKQWISRALALCVIGPAAAMLAQRVIAGDGSHETTLLTGASLPSSLIALLGVALLALIMGVVGGLLCDRREAMLGMGFVFGWVAWTSGQIGELFRFDASGGTLVRLSIEGLVLMLAVLTAMTIVSKARAGQDDTDPASNFGCGLLRAWITDKAMLAAIGASLLSGLVMGYFFGQGDLAGQSLGVGFGGGVLAGVVGPMIVGSLDQERKDAVPLVPMMIGVMLCGVVLPLVAMVVPGVDSLAEHTRSGDLPGFLIVSPSGWVGGALIGVPMGYSWVVQSHGQVQGGAASSRA